MYFNAHVCDRYQANAHERDSVLGENAHGYAPETARDVYEDDADHHGYVGDRG